MTENRTDYEALLGLLRSRHSCRGFLADPLPADLIEKIVAGALLSPSWCNAQPWQILVTCGEVTERVRRQLMEGVDAPSGPDFPFPERYAGVYLDRRRETGWALYKSVGVERGDRAGSGRQAMENYRLFGAPHLAVVTTEADLGVYGAVDCGAFVNNFMLIAQSLGVATVAQAAIATQSDRLRPALDIPANRRVVCGISFGYADVSHPANGFRTTRADLSEILTLKSA